MKVARRPCFSATDFTMNLKKRVLVGGGEHVVEGPVHLELAVRVLMVVLVGLPAQRQHVVADLGDHVVAAHDRLLVVAGFRRGIGRIRDRRAVGRDQEELGLDAGLDAAGPRTPPRRSAGASVSRGACATVLSSIMQLAATQATSRLPRQLDDRIRVGHRQHVGMRRRQVEPGGEAGEARAVLLHRRRSPPPAPASHAGPRTGRCRRS